MSVSLFNEKDGARANSFFRLEAAPYVNKFPSNSHKAYKIDDAEKAWRHWKDNCSAGRVVGVVASKSLVGPYHDIPRPAAPFIRI